MAALIFKLVLLSVVFSEFGTNAEIRAYGGDNATVKFNDADASFGPGVGYDGLVGVLYQGKPIDACGSILPPSFTNPNVTIFKFVLIARGNCDFALKVLNAQRAGYNGAIVYDPKSNELIRMNSGLPEVVSQIYIPSVFVGRDTAKTLNATYMHQQSEDARIELIDIPFDYLAYLVPFVVVTGVCFFSLLCFLLVRCLRDYRRTRRGRLSLQRLKKLPVKKYKKEDEYDVCAICLEDYEEGDTLRILPCQHAYHCKCVDPWLTSSKRICPLCKRKVLSDDESDSSSDEIEDSSDDENTPLVPASEAASPNAPRYGTGYALRNPFTSHRRFFGRRALSNTSIDSASTDSSYVDRNYEVPGTSAQSASRFLAESSEYQSQDLSPANVADAEVSYIMNSGEQAQADADTYLVSAELAMSRQGRVSESSIAVLSDDERLSPELPGSSSDYHTVDESTIMARTPYNVDSRLETGQGFNDEDIVVIAAGSTETAQDQERV